MSVEEAAALKKALERIEKIADSVETKIDLFKDELLEKVNEIETSIHKFDAFCHNILEENQKTIYKHIKKLEGTTAEEETEEEGSEE